MYTVLLPPGVNPIAVNKYIISYHHLTHSQTKHDVLSTHISESKFWTPARCNSCIRDLEKFGYPTCFNIFPILVCWWNCPCKFNAKAYSFPPAATVYTDTAFFGPIVQPVFLSTRGLTSWIHWWCTLYYCSRQMQRLQYRLMCIDAAHYCCRVLVGPQFVFRRVLHA
jgi:hypothetical protein